MESQVYLHIDTEFLGNSPGKSEENMKIIYNILDYSGDMRYNTSIGELPLT